MTKDNLKAFQKFTCCICEMSVNHHLLKQYIWHSFVSRTFILLASFLTPDTATVAKYWMTRFVFTVFPAPDSPLVNERLEDRRLKDM